uniref:RRM domain-containing protein n=1 Tax=Neogobius melanostomus TaxID=47308 RepID=A0A8C6THJ8_9GOBI
MKGKERSPLKKRTRVPDEGRDRGASHSSGKKTGSISATGSNSSVQSGGSSRRNIHADKRDMRDVEHNAPGRTRRTKANPDSVLGNLDGSLAESDLRRAFDRFGVITEVDIKRVRDYRKGEAWAYIQYESLDAAQAAWTHMRGFPLGGHDRRLRVDFAETEQRYQQPYIQLPLPTTHYDHLVPEPFAHRLPDPVRLRERSPLPVRFRDRENYLLGADYCIIIP